MATLDEKESQTMAKLTARLSIKGEVNSQKDLEALINLKKSEINKVILSYWSSYRIKPELLWVLPVLEIILTDKYHI